MALTIKDYSYFAPKKLRSFQQFTEEEVYLPQGPRAGMKYSCEFTPWMHHYFKMLDSNYKRKWITGSVQSGKTLHCTAIPCLYHLFETEEDVILCAPDQNMAQEVYEDKIKPVIQKSRFAEFLPTKGRGARGGKVDSIKFKNGTKLRFMGAGGGDGQRSSHTARVIIITEPDKCDKSGEASRETDPVSQFEARAKSFGSDARIYAECTVSTSQGRVFSEVYKFGTNTKIKFECPYCKAYIDFKRENFVGWQDAETVIEAGTNCRYLCNECEKPLNEEDRQEMMLHSLAVSEGQYIENGEVKGEIKKTDTLGFSWNAMMSPLLKMSDIAADEFKAERTDTDDARKNVYQFVWSLPYDEDVSQMLKLSSDTVLNKINSFKRGEIPDNTKYITIGIDLGLYQCWWIAIAWVDGAMGYVMDYGCIDVAQPKERSDLAVLNALRAFRDEFIKPGWDFRGGVRRADGIFVDSGFLTDRVYEFVSESGQGFFATKGLGTARNERAWVAPKPSNTRTIGHEWVISKQPNGLLLLEMHSDFWKTEVHNGFLAPMGQPGSLSIFNADKKEHISYAKHISSEVKEESFIPGKGRKETWNRKHKMNHLFDCTYMARCGADAFGIKLTTGDGKKVENVA